MVMVGLTDIHCHVIPGVDDGAADMDTALGILRMEYEQGVRTIICTPHFRQGLFETSRETVREQYGKLREQSADAFPDLKLALGCEFHRHSSLPGRARADEAYRMAGTDYVLLEFSSLDTIQVIQRHVTEVLMQGLRPVIAHVERYPALGRLEQIRFLTESGAYIQLNAGSILGEEGWRRRHFCSRLLKADLVHFIGSDAHSTVGRAPHIGACASYLEQKLGAGRTEQILVRNPARLLMNEYI